MNGWKTWAGVAGLLAGGALSALGMSDIANTVYSFSVPMVIVGLGHKMDKVLRAIGTAANSAADQLEKQGASGATAPDPKA